MRIKVDGAALICDRNGQPRHFTPDDLMRLNGLQLGDEECADYLDSGLADLGIIGGGSRLIISSDGIPRIHTTYWAPNPLSQEQQQELLVETLGQWDDGVGENGYEILLDTLPLTVWARRDESVRIEQFYDGHSVPAPPFVAIAAREGNLAALQAAIESGEEIDRRQRGYTPLQLAILNGHEREICYLLAHGADATAVDPQGNTTLILCACARDLDDDASARVARLLIQHGVLINSKDIAGHTASYIASSRGKSKFVGTIAEHPAGN